MDFTTYEAEVEKLSIYPFAKQENVASLLYPVLGLNGEASETLEKVKTVSDEGHTYNVPNNRKEEILKELGDVLWYITRVSTELGLSLKELYSKITISELSKNTQPFTSNAIDLSIHAGQVAEIYKKALRDDSGDIFVEMRTERKTKVVKELIKVLIKLIHLSENLDYDLDKVAETNINKLNKRNSNGTIQGEGDNR